MSGNVFHPEWSYDSNIYEVNVRQYTAEGTFKAFADHLPRLRQMGVEILWFMPITPIGFKGRKGSLGSYYAVSHYTDVNPEFGSLQDFKDIVSGAHDLGFKVIVDWIANHTSNDNSWIEQHPDFYLYDDNKAIINPHGWSDVSQLDYTNNNMRHAMIDAMKYWITGCDIDGFRCDMAHLVPLDFWASAKLALKDVKPDLFWLAECEAIEYHTVFDATYTWKWMHTSEDNLKANLNVDDYLSVLNDYNNEFMPEALRVYFTSNHDENSWNGTEYEKYGEAAEMFAVFSCTWNGLAMIYSGQEMPNYKRLKFFEKDSIEWSGIFSLHDFYKTLLTLRKNNKALRAGDPAVITRKVPTNYDEKIFAFQRKIEDQSIVVILNFSEFITDVRLIESLNKHRNVFTGDIIDLNEESIIQTGRFGYHVFEKVND
ncbi:MAG: alpha-amylase family glycosyl hydrolase [Ginsengibacter sp.]